MTTPLPLPLPLPSVQLRLLVAPNLPAMETVIVIVVVVIVIAIAIAIAIAIVVVVVVGCLDHTSHPPQVHNGSNFTPELSQLNQDFYHRYKLGMILTRNCHNLTRIFSPTTGDLRKKHSQQTHSQPAPPAQLFVPPQVSHLNPNLAVTDTALCTSAGLPPQSKPGCD